MKKFLVILVLGLLLSGNAYAKDLTGTKLICKKPLADPYRTKSIHFINDYKATIFQISNWKIRKSEVSYKVKPDEIDLGRWITIDRETLSIGYGTEPCEIADKDFDLDLFMQNLLDDRVKEQESKNKL